MRLIVPKVSPFDKILRDLDAGAPAAQWIAEARTVAERFGTRSRLDQRLSKLREVARVLGHSWAGPRPAPASEPEEAERAPQRAPRYRP